MIIFFFLCFLNWRPCPSLSSIMLLFDDEGFYCFILLLRHLIFYTYDSTSDCLILLHLGEVLLSFYSILLGVFIFSWRYFQKFKNNRQSLIGKCHDNSLLCDLFSSIVLPYETLSTTSFNSKFCHFRDLGTFNFWYPDFFVPYTRVEPYFLTPASVFQLLCLNK